MERSLRHKTGEQTRRHKAKKGLQTAVPATRFAPEKALATAPVPMLTSTFLFYRGRTVRQRSRRNKRNSVGPSANRGDLRHPAKQSPRFEDSMPIPGAHPRIQIHRCRIAIIRLESLSWNSPDFRLAPDNNPTSGDLQKPPAARIPYGNDPAGMPPVPNRSMR
jgi:hypothetical protein